MSFLFVGLGGALGAVLRYALSMLPNSSEFPVWTLVTNFIGAVVIGFVAQMSAKKQLSSESVLFWKTGVCGGFTTFSTFSLESYNLFNQGMPVLAGVYIAASVVLCLLGIAVGTWAANIFAV